MVKKLFKQFKYGRKGFTLIELLVVVAILGVLAAVAIPNVAKFIGRGNVEAANTELATIETAVAAFQADNLGSIPDVTSWDTISADLAPYLQNVAKIKGQYTITSVGGVVTVTGVAGSYDGVYWDDSTGKWTGTAPVVPET